MDVNYIAVSLDAAEKYPGVHECVRVCVVSTSASADARTTRNRVTSAYATPGQKELVSVEHWVKKT